MRGERRFSQVIAEGEGISLVVVADAAAAVAAAEAGGADALALRAPAAAPRLPVLWLAPDPPQAAHDAGADAWVLPAERLRDEDGLDQLYSSVLALGLDCVVEVREEEQLERALDRLDPEVVLLSSPGGDPGDQLDRVLELLHDLPAGKLAVAELGSVDRDTLDELERAGVDAVIVQAEALSELAP